VVNAPSPDFIPPDPTNYATRPDVAERAVKHVEAAYDKAQSIRGNLKQKWREEYLAWRAVRERRHYAGRANIVDPEPSRSIETVNAILEDALSTHEKIIRGLPGEGERIADREQAEANESLIHYQLTKGSKANLLLRNVSKSLCIYGTAITRMWWDVETRPVPKRRRKRGEPKLPEMVQVYRGPRIRQVQIEDCYPSRIIGAQTCNEQDFIIERRDVPRRELLAMEDRGHIANMAQLEDKARSVDKASIEAADKHTSVAGGYEGSYGTERTLKTDEVLMYEGAFDLDNDGVQEDCWIWVSEGIALKVVENPYWHRKRTYQNAHHYLAPGEFYGVGLVEWVLDLWNELCDKHNQGLDSSTLALNPMWKVGATAGFDHSAVLMRPSGVIRCHGDSDQLNPITLPDLAPVAYQAMGVLRNQIRETTSATDLLQAQSGADDYKATVYQGMIAQATSKIKHTLRNVDDMLISEWGDQAWGLNQQYADRRMLVRVLGREGFKFRPMRPEDLQYSMDWSGRGTANMGSQLARGMAFERLLATATPLVLKGALKMNLEEPFKEWLYSMGLTGVEKMFETGVEPLDPEHENVLMMQRQAVDVHPNDNHDQHARSHAPLLRHEDPVVRDIVAEHLRETISMRDKQANAQRAVAEARAQQFAAQTLGPSSPQNGGAARQAAAPPALANQQRFGPDIGGAKQIGEDLARGLN
jgi:hypothetical protein